MSRTVAIDLCPKSGLNLAKRWLSKTNIQDTKVIVGLKLLTTGTKVTTVVCAQGKKIIWFKISSVIDFSSKKYIVSTGQVLLVSAEKILSVRMHRIIIVL